MPEEMNKTMKSHLRKSIIACLCLLVFTGFCYLAFEYSTSLLAGSEKRLDDSGLPVVRESLGDYSWSELSEISSEISSATDSNDALSVAVRYHLLSDDKKTIPDETKEIVLTDNTTEYVRIVGFYQDEKTDGSGKAGITFMFEEAVAQQPMNETNTNSGGWERSSLRAWLNNSYVKELPSDLRDCVVPVNKITNNTGVLKDASGVSATSDMLWLFSASEICGQIDWWKAPDDAGYNSVLNAEGSRYLFFLNRDFRNIALRNVLQKQYKNDRTDWWLRSPSPALASSFRYIMTTEEPYEVAYANDSCGVVPGFCL